MKLEDIKVGMKVKLLGKHALDNYDDINDWYKRYDDDNSIKRLRTQGYGYVLEINGDDCIWVDECEDGKGWCFIASDLKPYKEITEQNTNESATQKTPKEWLLTPLAIFTTRDGDECITLRNNTATSVNYVCMWDNDLKNDYTDDLIWHGNSSGNDIMQITYNGEIVWKRKKYMTLTDAIKTDKRLKHKTWSDFYEVKNVLSIINNTPKEKIIEAFTVVEWEVE